MRTAVGVVAMILLINPVASARGGPPTSIPIDDRFEVIRLNSRRPDYRKAFRQAGRLMKDWTIDFAGTGVDGVQLERLARKDPKEPFVRVLREGLRRPVDVHDFLLLIDDLLVAGRKGLYGKRVFILPGRARAVGALIHPDDVFRKNRPRRYPHRKDELDIDPPRRHPDMVPAEDGDLLGPRWVYRYKNPITRESKLKALAEKNPSGTFAARVESLVKQLESQGADVGLYTTVRNRHRGYLMWGSFVLARKKNRKSLMKTVYMLQDLNNKWELHVPIRWYHPGGWRATVEAARQMKDAYDVVYASRAGASRSRHYDGEAVDLTAVGLPRKLSLVAPDGTKKIFDLSDAEQTRDINLTPELVDWLEKHFQMEKLKPDYPHWNDTAPADPKRRQEVVAALGKPKKEWIESRVQAGPSQKGIERSEPKRDWLGLVISNAPTVVAGLGVAGLLLLLLGLRRRRH